MPRHLISAAALATFVAIALGSADTNVNVDTCKFLTIGDINEGRASSTSGDETKNDEGVDEREDPADTDG